MKKIIIIISIFMLFYLLLNKSNDIYNNEESIRYRIIANSNSYEDQKLKWEINSELIDIFLDISANSKNINETRILTKKNISYIKKIINKYTSDYSINYGINYFPSKELNNVKYKEGNYESLVITLGTGNGDNWWCMMFPPLCLMEANYSSSEAIEYEVYLYDRIKKYL